MVRFDLQYDNKELIIKDNDVLWDESDKEHVQDAIQCAPGWYKENFNDGVDIIKFLSSSGQEQILARKIKLELESDLYTVINPKVYFNNEGELIVIPNASI